MWRKATIGGLAALAIVAGGAGVTIAHAAQTSDRPDRRDRRSDRHRRHPRPAPRGRRPRLHGPTRAGRDAAKQILGKVKDFQHAEWVTKGDGNTYVTHEAILGEVTAVSATSITVKSTDGTSMTFAVTADTKVHQRQKGVDDDADHRGRQDRSDRPRRRREVTGPDRQEHRRPRDLTHRASRFQPGVLPSFGRPSAPETRYCAGLEREAVGLGPVGRRCTPLPELAPARSSGRCRRAAFEHGEVAYEGVGVAGAMPVVFVGWADENGVTGAHTQHSARRGCRRGRRPR